MCVVVAAATAATAATAAVAGRLNVEAKFELYNHKPTVKALSLAWGGR